MNEFIEKLIARLEEVSIPIFDEDTEMESKVIFTDIAKNIANQLAEEYKQCTLCYLQSPCEYQNEDAKLQDELLADKNGWIPCSERLPENDDEVLCWYEYRIMQGTCAGEMKQTYGIGYYFSYHKTWGGEVSNGRDCRVIAWKPIKPYKEEAEQALKQIGE